MKPKVSSTKPKPLAPQSTQRSHEDSDLLDQLRKTGLKVTESRKKILQVLNDKYGPLTPDEIYQSVRPADLDRVTIYRCLAAFEEVNLVRRSDFGDGIARYELQLGAHHHHHVICRKCKSIRHLDDCFLHKIEEQILSTGFSQLTHNLEFFGICPNCQKL